jgi:hypothetical protein
MTIGQGNIIEAADYNGLQSAVATILGNGTGDRGYGQTLASSQVAVHANVAASHIINLKADIESISIHQTNAVFNPALATISSGGVIYASDWIAYSNAIISLTGTRFNAAAAQMSLEEPISASISGWNGTRQHIVTITFSSADAGRHYFNAGGEIRFSPSMSGFSASKGVSWNALTASFRPMRFNYESTTAFAGSASSVGWYDLTSSYQTIFSITGGATYSQNDIQVEALCNVASNSSGTATQMTWRITYRDDQSENIDENVDGTLNSKIQTYRPQAATPPTGATVTLSAPTVATSSGP